MSYTPTMLPLSPGGLSLLPLFYVGWSDSVLSPSEMQMIHAQIRYMPFLTDDDRRYLVQWTNPQNPPDEAIFRTWLEAIRYYATGLENKQDLVELGLAIARAGSGEGETFDEKTAEHLLKMAQTLGVSGRMSSSILLDSGLNKSTTISDLEFDIDSLRMVMDGDQATLSDRIRQLLRDDLFKLDHYSVKEEYRELTLMRVKALANQGLSSYSFPAQYGGGDSKRDHITVFEMLSFSDLSMTIKFGVQFGLFGGALYLLGTADHHRLYLSPMMRGDLLGCFAMTETGHGSNVKGLRTTARYDATTDELIIHTPHRGAGKEYIGNALHASMAVVFAQLIVGDTSHGVHAILVPLRDSSGKLLTGIEVEDCGYKMGLNGVDNGRIWFNQVRVPRNNLLNRYGNISPDGIYTSPIENGNRRFFTMLGALVVGRICVGMAGVSAAKKALTIAIRYAEKRRQFNHREEDPETIIMDYPTHQERLLPLLAATYAYHFSLRNLADQYAAKSDEDMRQIETLAAGLKSKATWLATKTIQECREACGGKGYLVENQLSALKADSDIFSTFEGDNTVLMQLVAKGVLTEFKQAFHDESTATVMRVIMRKVNYTFSEMNPIYKGNTDRDHLLSHEFINGSLNYRYQKHLMSLSERMQKYLKRKLDPYQAYLKVQVHMVDLAHAYIDRLTYRYFYATEQQSIGDARSALRLLRQLYGLDLIYQHRGWYLENDYCYGSKTKAIRRVRAKLLQDIRPYASVMVEAFGIPEELIAAEIV